MSLSAGLGHTSVLVVAKDHDSRFSSNEKEVSVPLHSELTHCGDGAWGSFLAEGSMFVKCDILIGVHALDGIFLFVVTVKLDFVLRVVIR